MALRGRTQPPKQGPSLTCGPRGLTSEFNQASQVEYFARRLAQDVAFCDFIEEGEPGDA
jgi:hypothetical protein